MADVPSIIRYLLRGSIAALFALSASAAPLPSPADNPVQNEDAIVARARAAAKADDDAAMDAHLAGSAVGAFAALPNSALLARRAAVVCGWLQNENDHTRAMKLARRITQQLASMKEAKDSDRAERLYWEAWLQAQVLDQKVAAIELLKAAEKLAPDDERITGLELGLVASVAEFGR